MTDLHAIGERVDFDQEAAERLSALLRGTADLLDGQRDWRRMKATAAEQEWRGVHADRFAARIDYFRRGATSFAKSMRTTADRVDDCAEAAREEQDRRNQAQEWVDDQNARGFFEKVEDFFLGRDGPRVPEIHPPAAQPATPVAIAFVEPSPRPMSVASARPEDLESFVRAADEADQHLSDARATLARAVDTFTERCGWARFDPGGLPTAFATWIGEVAQAAPFVKTVAAAFRAAGSDGSVVTLPDAALEASLRAAGQDRGPATINYVDPVALGSDLTTGYADDPVNTAIGNFVEFEQDLAFGGLLESLTFTRVYNSRSDRGGPFGARWASWASARLVARPDGAEFEGPDGQRALFPRSGDGFGRVAGVQALVERTGSGLAVVFFSGPRWEFDAAGRPDRLWSGPGTEVRLHHDGDGRLAELVHERGRRVAVTWDGDRIAALHGSDGRSVTYRYDDTGDLVAVRGAAGERSYGLDNGLVTSVTDADGVVALVNTYDEYGRVSTQLSPFGRRTTFTYLPGNVTVTADDSGGPMNTYVHDAAGRLLSVTDGHDQTLRRTYDDWGNPVAVVDRGGAITVSEWDDRSRLVRRTLPTGASFAYTYDAGDRILAVTASTGAEVRYRYTGAERTPAEILDPEGGVTRLAVEGGVVREVTDPDGVVLALRHDDDGNLVAAVDADGNTARVERDAGGRPVAAVTPLGRRTTFAYDDRGLLTTRTGPAGDVWRHEYSAAGRPTAVVDPTGARTEIRYGPHGQVTETVDALGAVTTRRHDVLGNLAGVVAPDGAKWEYTYDALSRLVALADPAGATWLREYDVDGNLTGSLDPTGIRYGAEVDPAGQITGLSDGLTSSAFEYDELGRTVAHVRPDGSALRATYDRCGRRTSETAPDGGVTRFTYTPAGRLRTAVAPSGATETYEYDRCGRTAALVDAVGARWVQRHDADGALVARVAPTGEQEELTYDAAGRLVRRAAPGGTTTYDHDAIGRVVAVTDGTGGVRRFTYDAAGRMVSAADPNGGVTAYEYDGRGRVVAVTDPLGGRTARRYDEVGRLVAETDPLGRTTTIAYDPAGHVVERVDGAGVRVRWTYDVSGRVATVHGDGVSVSVERDVLGRPVGIDEQGRRRVELRWDTAGRLVERRCGDLALRWRHDLDGNRTALGLPDGSEVGSTHDAAGRTTAIEHPLLGRVRFDRDVAGRLVGLHGDGMTQRWTYEAGELVAHTVEHGGTRRRTDLTRDAAGRVVSAAVDGAVRRYSFDPAGQLRSVAGPDGERSFAYDANGRLVHETGPVEVRYSYDAAGQLVAAGGVQFTYDGAGRRAAETGPAGERRYRWDGLGRLAGLDTTNADGGARTITTTVDALGELTEVDGTPLLWDTADPLSPLVWMGQRAVVGDGRPLAVVDAAGHAAGTDPWLDTDWQGSVGADPGDPWGSGGPGVTLGHRGELQVDGLVWLRHRVYDPGTRAFLSPDPVPPVPGTAYAANPYHYAGNDPLDLADPLGLKPMTDADLRAYTDGLDKGFFKDARDWVGRNKEMIAGAVITTAGVTLMATGVGGPVGVLMVGAGTSMMFQEATTGHVDPKQLAFDTALTIVPFGRIAGAAGRFIPEATGLVRVAASETATGIRSAASAAGTKVTTAVRDAGGWVGRRLPWNKKLDPPALRDDLATKAETEVPGGSLGGGALVPVGNFRNEELAMQHYEKHVLGIDRRVNGAPRMRTPDMPEFDSFEEYVAATRQFMGGNAPEGVLEGIRRGGDLIRLDPKTGYFGIRDPDGVIRTMFRPDGGPEGWMQYFRDRFR